MENRIHLRQAEIGPMANFIYLIGDPQTHKAAVVDPAWDVDAIIDLANRDGYEIDKILITHYHQDHLGGRMMGQSIEGAADLLAKVKAKVYLNKHEAEVHGAIILDLYLGNTDRAFGPQRNHDGLARDAHRFDDGKYFLDFFKSNCSEHDKC